MLPLHILLNIVCKATNCSTKLVKSESRRRKAVYARIIFLILAREQGFRDYEIMWHIKRDKSMATYYDKRIDSYKQSSFFNKSLLKAKNYAEI